ncbi:hypothetical protein [Capnocytophaga catalasegens]|uniref:Uncharacterized protein n=1 Tax=Capnocytophaga catalasegens TaxID=1004260 RepID=A0AAV5AWS9_9FLAO|nr:hypothetical protein [Capnocytophaga catalasegens]GIZ14089.1 hypothetical protein RCZ03_00900 [Capnocytophaga catalasegens]GJM49087.1 hypothetical protein RCZ15_00630 [Capnocytophaga catalasegens]GJM52348.1 hypothetical protein RCZ16_06660 [Capnocytophaga catalasegens]
MKKLNFEQQATIIGGISPGGCALLGAALLTHTGIIASIFRKEIAECWNS